ncbi:MAG: phage virion morphogenesis protein [Caulobacter sp.]|nr:phage virion morphogenesis protein [Caulobacter sp.]
MTGLTMRLQLGGENRALNALDALASRMDQKLPWMRAVARYLVDSVRHNFEEQKAPDGTPWTPSVRAKLQGGVTLVEHGILRDSFHDDAGENFASVSTADVRAATFQFGRLKQEPVAAHTRRITQAFGRPLRAPVFQSVGAHTRNPNIVARPMMGVSAADEAEIIALGEDHLAGGLS